MNLANITPIRISYIIFLGAINKIKLVQLVDAILCLKPLLKRMMIILRATVLVFVYQHIFSYVLFALNALCHRGFDNDLAQVSVPTKIYQSELTGHSHILVPVALGNKFVWKQ